MKWWGKASDSGDGWSSFNLAKLHEKTSGKDDPKIKLLKEKALNAGFSFPEDKISILMSENKSSGSDRAAPDERNREPKQQVSAGFGKILVVDDEKRIRDILKLAVKESGFSSVEAEDGAVALKVVADNPDICMIMLDLRMPNVNGFQFIKTLRALRAAEGVPIIMVTGNATPENIAEAKKLKVTAWVTKPFEINAISDIIVRYLGNRMKAGAA
ncbi:MAG: response regulator [Oligoflexales bacterium]|nr:response regulator [Oligoflexales bacterium]